MKDMVGEKRKDFRRLLLNQKNDTKEEHGRANKDRKEKN